MTIFTCLLSLICLMSVFSNGSTIPTNKEAKKNFESEEYTRASEEDSKIEMDSSEDRKSLKLQETEKISRPKRWLVQSTSTSQNPEFVYKPWLFAV